MARLERLTIRGFKSIRELDDFKLERLNVLIGANGAGKSNFISFFRMVVDVANARLGRFVLEEGGPDAVLFGGRRWTRHLEVTLCFTEAAFTFSFAPAGETLVGENMSGITDEKFVPSVHNWRVFHFEDTSRFAPVRTAQPVRDNLILKHDASNLAPYLRYLREKHRASYASIVETVRLVAPFFRDFVHRDDPGERVELEWIQDDDPDTPRGPLQISDGTLRFICLATLLLQPVELQPDIIIIDEPELGLHPYAIVVLASLLRQASERKQVIVSTQSVELVNQLEPADIVVTERRDGASVFHRLDPDHLKEWLEDYSLGELWKMNVVGGRPSR